MYFARKKFLSFFADWTDMVTGSMQMEGDFMYYILAVVARFNESFLKFTRNSQTHTLTKTPTVWRNTTSFASRWQCRQSIVNYCNLLEWSIEEVKRHKLQKHIQWSNLATEHVSILEAQQIRTCRYWLSEGSGCSWGHQAPSPSSWFNLHNTNAVSSGAEDPGWWRSSKQKGAKRCLSSCFDLDFLEFGNEDFFFFWRLEVNGIVCREMKHRIHLFGFSVRQSNWKADIIMTCIALYNFIFVFFFLDIPAVRRNLGG